MYNVVIDVEFDAAHRLLCYEGKCKKLHGHSYVATVGIRSCELEDSGFVLDFGILKATVKDWIDKNWDHSTILNDDDLLCQLLSDDTYGCEVFRMKGDPTAEHMAEHLCRVMCNVLCRRENLQVEFVTIRETRTSRATYRPLYLRKLLEKCPREYPGSS